MGVGGQDEGQQAERKLIEEHIKWFWSQFFAPVEIINKVQGRGAEGPIVKFQQQGMGIIKPDQQDKH